jgi:putative pyruvate formate lyase activating enzyme
MSTQNISTSCKHCPRHCGVHRETTRGFCRVASAIQLASVSLHFGEEPILSGTSGSAAFFFSGCTLRCAFCQNWQISHFASGRSLSIAELATLFLLAQKSHAHNINLVSGTPFYPDIIQALLLAKSKGLHLPIMWNTSGYETLEAIEQLKEAGVSIFLPDLKFVQADIASYYTLATDYPQVAMAAITKMMQDNPLRYNEQGMLIAGVIIRHLILPTHIENTKGVLQWYAREAKGQALLSMMSQYTPVYMEHEKRSIPNRFLSLEEEAEVLEFLREYDIDDGFFQDLIWQSDWLPDFSNKQNPFSEKLAKSLWHYADN